MDIAPPDISECHIKKEPDDTITLPQTLGLETVPNNIVIQPEMSGQEMEYDIMNVKNESDATISHPDIKYNLNHSDIKYDLRYIKSESDDIIAQSQLLLARSETGGHLKLELDGNIVQLQMLDQEAAVSMLNGTITHPKITGQKTEPDDTITQPRVSGQETYSNDIIVQSQILCQKTEPDDTITQPRVLGQKTEPDDTITQPRVSGQETDSNDIIVQPQILCQKTEPGNNIIQS